MEQKTKIKKARKRGLEKPYKCKRCPKEYYKDRNLKLHEKHWHGVKNV